MIGCPRLFRTALIGSSKRCFEGNPSLNVGLSRINADVVKPTVLARFHDISKKHPFGRTTRREISQQKRQAELDYIDYAKLNGVYTEESDVELRPGPEPSVDPLFEELSRDAEQLESEEPKKAQWEFRSLRALVAYLADTKEFGKRGEGLVLLTVAVTFFIMMPPFVMRGLIPFLGIVAILGGIVTAVAGVFALGDSFSPLPVARLSTPFVQKGIFRHIRHPLYAGILLLSIGLSIVSGNEFRLLLSGVLWWLIEETIKGEEKELEEVYPEYTDYKMNVGKLFPRSESP